jgi:hypothetical protein
MTDKPSKLPTWCVRCEDNTLYCSELRESTALGPGTIDIYIPDPLMCAMMICVRCHAGTWARYGAMSQVREHGSPVKGFDAISPP